MEVHSVPWSWLGEYDRKYPRVRTTPLPGHRQLPPSMWSARELFIVGRTFKLLLQGRLTRPWIVIGHTPKSCRFRLKELTTDRRHLPWETMERHVLQDHVRWMNSVHTLRSK